MFDAKAEVTYEQVSNRTHSLLSDFLLNEQILLHLPRKDSFTVLAGVFLWSMEGPHMFPERHVILEHFATFLASKQTIQIHMTFAVFLHGRNLN